MRGDDDQQGGMFSYVNMEERIPAAHPARTIRAMVDRALKRMDGELSKLYSSTGRPSIAPERLMRAQLLMVLYSIRSERQLMEQVDYNLLFRWFVGLGMDEPVWDVTVFTKNRERLIAGEASQQLLLAVVEEAREQQLLSEEHFTVDGTLIQAWASRRSFHDKQDPPAPGCGSGAKGEVLLRDRVQSSTDADARLYRKSQADKSVPCYQGHVLMENRSGLVVAAEASLASRDMEREAALRMLDRTLTPIAQRPAGHAVSVGADTGYQEPRFIDHLRRRGIAPHISEYVQGNLGKNGLSAEERADERRLISLQRRKRIEEVFGWGKLTGSLRQVKLRGLRRVDWFYRMVMVGYNLMRIRRLIPIPATAC